MPYNDNTIAEKNITLAFEFERYILENPGILEQIPDGAEVILLPKDDPELYRINFEAAQSAQATPASAPLIFVEVEALAPHRSRLVNPQLTTRPTPL